MKYELSQTFYFEAAHTLQRQIETDSSRRIHGHTYLAEVTLEGRPDPTSGMLIDLGLLRRDIERLREQLDHRLLDEVPGLGPVTLENLCRFIFEALAGSVSGVVRVSVGRQASGDRCTLSR